MLAQLPTALRRIAQRLSGTPTIGGGGDYLVVADGSIYTLNQGPDVRAVLMSVTVQLLGRSYALLHVR
ncbi:hypothetical protein [Ferrimicrobium acidiphilum]|uniref:hypothetical protein n=1 Tax=Ferrimicrobium acidiphilum TaxID=121039 RepID=UPI0023F1F548|nr:hypothetical protein [Ferrimicrobium acidiphilum]